MNELPPEQALPKKGAHMPKDESLTATTAEDMLGVLKGGAYQTALSLHEAGKALGCKIDAKTGSRSYKIVYSVAAPKKRTLFTIECNAKKWRVKANLFRISAYEDMVGGSSEAIRSSIKATRPCELCNPNCKGRSSYVIDGETYLPCFGGGHYFNGLDAGDWARLEELIALESKV
jgi:hypothetical protein